MAGPLHQFFAVDHARLHALLERAFADPENLDRAAYSEFRAGLLKHIAMEEKVLLPAAQRLSGGNPLPLAAKLRLDHGAIAALLVPSPSAPILRAIRAILATHNALEEGADGIYEQCERLAGAEIGEILERLRAFPEVAVAPHLDGPTVIEALRRTLARAGYDFSDYE